MKYFLFALSITFMLVLFLCFVFADTFIKVKITQIPSVFAPIYENENAFVIGIPSIGIIVLRVDRSGNEIIKGTYPKDEYKEVFTEEGEYISFLFNKFTGIVKPINLKGSGIRNTLEVEFEESESRGKPLKKKLYFACTGGDCKFYDELGNFIVK